MSSYPLSRPRRRQTIPFWWTLECMSPTNLHTNTVKERIRITSKAIKRLPFSAIMTDVKEHDLQTVHCTWFSFLVNTRASFLFPSILWMEFAALARGKATENRDFSHEATSWESRSQVKKLNTAELKGGRSTRQRSCYDAKKLTSIAWRSVHAVDTEL